MQSEQDEGPQIQNTVEGETPNASRHPDGKVVLVVHDGLPSTTVVHEIFIQGLYTLRKYSGNTGELVWIGGMDPIEA